ncbi:MAG: hypothetical protein OXH69_17715 [Acidobacteria bacterium]|nr:hypothetical protein [Acidobacteriota bacterium]
MSGSCSGLCFLDVPWFPIPIPLPHMEQEYIHWECCIVGTDDCWEWEENTYDCWP